MLIRSYVCAGMGSLELIVDKVSQNQHCLLFRPWVFVVTVGTDTFDKFIDINIEFLIGYARTSFLATLDYDPGTPGDPIVFNVAPLNLGGHYDVATGIYSVPVDGVYEFILHVRCVEDASCAAWIDVDNVPVSQILLFYTWCALSIQQYLFQ